MLRRVSDVHGYGTRSAGAGIHLGARDRGMVGYRVPTEWAALSGRLRGMGSLVGFKRESRAGFLAGYASAVCTDRGCYVCKEQRGQGEVREERELVVEVG